MTITLYFTIHYLEVCFLGVFYFPAHYPTLLGIKSKAFSMLGNGSAIEYIPSPVRISPTLFIESVFMLFCLYVYTNIQLCMCAFCN